VRFLADESCDFAVVRALRAAGHDVVAVAEKTSGSGDSDVIEFARRDDRVLLTEDKDFGQLVFSALAGSAGVVLIRYPTNVRDRLAGDVVRLAERSATRLQGAFVTLSPGRVRISHLPQQRS
jgi:predicted nuclease of predicted toxin-antitoxin system